MQVGGTYCTLVSQSARPQAHQFQGLAFRVSKGQRMRNVAILVTPQQVPAGRKEHGLFLTELPHQRYVATSMLIAATLFHRYINIKYEHGTSMHSEVLLDNGPIYPGALHGGQAPERPPKPHAPWPSKERPWGLPR